MVALGLTVLVVLLLVWGLSRLGGGSAGEESTASSAASEAPVAETTAAETEESLPAETSVQPSSDAVGNSTTTVSSQVETQAQASPVIGEITQPEITECALENLVVTASMEVSDVPAGVQPHFYMTVHNPTNGECVINLDEQPLRFEVFNMATNERLWGDIDCNVSEGRGQLTLLPGQQRTYEAVWSRTTSAQDSCANRQAVGEGSYVLVASVGANSSQSYPFTLRA